MQIKAAFSQYERYLVGKGIAPDGVKRYVEHMKRFLTFLGLEADHEQITETAVQAYQEELMTRLAPSTVLNNMIAIRSFCRWCQRVKLRNDDPTLWIDRPRRPKTAPRALRQAQIQELLHVLRVPADVPSDEAWLWSRNRRLIYLLIYTGLRISEAAKLLWDDVDLDAAYLIVRKGKGGKDRTIPLHPVLIVELRQIENQKPATPVISQIDGTRLQVSSMENIFDRWLRKLGPHITAHQLRHTFATELLRAKVDIRHIQELMGHEDLETTERYLMVDPERLRPAVNMLPDW